MFETIIVAVFSLVALFVAVWFLRYVVSVLRGDYRHARGSKSVWWIPGGGSHGGAGGQVPPIVPDRDEED